MARIDLDIGMARTIAGALRQTIAAERERHAAAPVCIAATELLAHAELHLHHPDLAAACRRYVNATSPRARAACTTPDERMTILTTWQSWREAIA